MSEGQPRSEAPAPAPSRRPPPAGGSEAMRKRLAAESASPLTAPLLFASVVLTGKGVTDALITVAKVSAGIRGVSLSETFYGVPVLAIDAGCVALGLALGVVTWRARPK
jgi:hypothetical protein